MKKAFYLLLIGFYAGAGILGLSGNGYSEVGGATKMLNKNLGLIIVLSVIIGCLVAYYFPQVFPKAFGQQNKIGKGSIIAIFFSLSFALTIGVLEFGNSSFGHQKIINVEGYIERKWSERGYKVIRYYVAVRDTISQDYYEFRVRKNIFDQIGNVGDKISKEFYRGSLGVIYRYGY